jgi:hypothetical protein
MLLVVAGWGRNFCVLLGFDIVTGFGNRPLRPRLRLLPYDNVYQLIL